MKNLILGILCVLTNLSVTAQLPYTENLYDFAVESDIEYGQVTNFAGITDTLLLDIYKPIGDNNCTRPCLVLIHGGAWISGSKNEGQVVNIAQSFAQKGWVVASINYRLGTHKTPSYEMYWACNDDISVPCGYIADSAEVFRANYRGQQDAKGAIRFMKNRAELDSVDIQNVFIAGESAGAFVAYAAAFMNNESEKPEFCNTMPDAPNPDPDLVSCLPPGYSLERPDLGSVQGNLNLGGHNTSVQGVGSFYGGMMNFEMLEDETDWPVIYMFHQGSDVIVNYNYGRLLGRIDWECFSPTSLCQNYARYPKAFGSAAISDYFSGLAESPERTVDIIENYEYMNDCFDNGHSIDNWVLRAQNMADLFAERIAENGNEPNSGPCNLSHDPTAQFNIDFYPNPSNGVLTIRHDFYQNLIIRIYEMDGSLVREFNTPKQKTIELPTGVYNVQISSSNYEMSAFKRLIVL